MTRTMPTSPLPTQGAPTLPSDAAPLLETALAVLLDPLAQDDLLAWREAIRAPLMALAGADVLGMHFPFLPPAAAWDTPHFTPQLLEDFARSFQHADPVAQRVEALGLEVAHQWEVIDPDTFHQTPIYNELQRPFRLFNLVTMRTPLGDGAHARFWLTQSRESTAPADPGRLALLRAVTPALRVGLTSWQRLGGQRAALAAFVDRLADGVLLFDLTGALLHVNASAQRLLCDDLEAAHVRAAARQAAMAMGRGAMGQGASAARPVGRGMVRVRSGAQQLAAQATAAVRTVRTVNGCYQMDVTMAPAGLFGRDPAIMVLLQRQVATPLTDEAVRARYALSPRQVTVARLLADGLSDAELAARLGVTLATARNHVAHVLLRLGVNSRRRIAPLLQDTGAPA